MATKTLAEILEIVRFRGDFRNVQRFPTANVNAEIQAAWTELYELVADTNEGYFDTSATAATTAGTAFVAGPSDMWRVRGVDRLDGSDYIPLDQVGIDDRNRFGSTTDEPSAYRLTARGIDLYPTPGAIYTLRVTYTPTAPVLSAAREYFNGWEEYVIYGALIRLTLNQQRTGGDWERQLAMARERITRGASQRKAAEPEYLALREGGYGDEREAGWWW